MSWGQWTTVSEGHAGPGTSITAVTLGGDRIALFLADPNGGVYTASGSADHWSQWTTVSEGHAGPGTSITAVTLGGDRIALFLADPNGGVYTASGSADHWSQWTTVSGGHAGPGTSVTAIGDGPGRFVLFLADPGGGVYTTSGSAQSGWNGWTTVSGGHAGPGTSVTALALEGDRFALFLADPNGGVYTTSGSAQSGWNGWTTVSGGHAGPGTSVTALALEGDRFALFLADPNGGVYTTSGSAQSSWDGWSNVSGIPTLPGSPVSAVRLGSDLFALFVANPNLFVADPSAGVGVLTTTGNVKRDWDLWSSVSKGHVAGPGTSITAVALGGDRIALFLADPNGGVYTTSGNSVVTGRPYIDSTTVYGPTGDAIAPITGPVPLTVGVRYTVGVHIQLSPGTSYMASLEVNPLLHVPAALNLLNRATGNAAVAEPQTRRFAFTPSEPGSFALGFQFRQYGTNFAFGADDGIRVLCSATGTGLYGYVTSYVTRGLVGGASITTGTLSTASAIDGSWCLPTANGAPLQVTISKAGYSSTIAVNVIVPSGSGVRIDTPLEDPFAALRSSGLTYTTYIDYSRGRTILHTVRINPMSSSGIVSLAQAPELSAQVNLLDTATAQNSLVIINGGFFDDHGRSQGYLYINGYANPTVLWSSAQPGSPDDVEPENVLPMLTIAGASVHQRIDVVHSESDFMSTTSSQWHRDSGGNPIWAPFGVSDVTYALQVAPTLFMNGNVITPGDFDIPSPYQQSFPRTAVGVGPGAGANTLYLVVADGERVNGGNGATGNQLGEFFRDVLGATAAMAFDCGESSEMVLKGASGQRIVNMLTSENNAAGDGYVPKGSVPNYLKIGL